MVVRSPVRGPDFTRQVEFAQAVVEKAQSLDWEFGKVPELFAMDSRADVVAKELVIVHDGHRQTLIGHLVMAGIGSRFNLMGPLQPDAEFKIKPNSLLEDLGDVFGYGELEDYLEGTGYDRPVDVDYFNHTMFFTLRDMIFWHVLNGSGGFPSSLEHMKRYVPSLDEVESQGKRLCGCRNWRGAGSATSPSCRRGT